MFLSIRCYCSCYLLPAAEDLKKEEEEEEIWRRLWEQRRRRPRHLAPIFRDRFRRREPARIVDISLIFFPITNS